MKRGPRHIRTNHHDIEEGRMITRENSAAILPQSAALNMDKPRKVQKHNIEPPKGPHNKVPRRLAPNKKKDRQKRESPQIKEGKKKKCPKSALV